MRLFLTEHCPDEKKCGGCNYRTCSFFGLGDTHSEARAKFEEDDNYGQGLCSYCMVEMLSNGEYTIRPRDNRLREDDLAGLGDDAFDDMIEDQFGEEEDW